MGDAIELLVGFYRWGVRCETDYQLLHREVGDDVHRAIQHEGDIDLGTIKIDHSHTHACGFEQVLLVDIKPWATAGIAGVINTHEF